eukprot:3936491-Rhodomonas_salina.7
MRLSVPRPSEAGPAAPSSSIADADSRDVSTGQANRGPNPLSRTRDASLESNLVVQYPSLRTTTTTTSSFEIVVVPQGSSCLVPQWLNSAWSVLQQLRTYA